MILLYFAVLGLVAALSGAFMVFGHRLYPRWSKAWLRCVFAGALAYLALGIFSGIVYLFASARVNDWPSSVIDEVHVMAVWLGIIYAVGGVLGLHLVERAPAIRAKDGERN